MVVDMRAFCFVNEREALDIYKHLSLEELLVIDLFEYSIGRGFYICTDICPLPLTSS